MYIQFLTQVQSVKCHPWNLVCNYYRSLFDALDQNTIFDQVLTVISQFLLSSQDLEIAQMIKVEPFLGCKLIDITLENLVHSYLAHQLLGFMHNAMPIYRLEFITQGIQLLMQHFIVDALYCGINREKIWNHVSKLC